MDNVVVKISNEAPSLPAVIKVDGKTYHIND
jgi:hypothetical protein